HVTGLDAAEQQELEDVLYRRAAGEIPEAYAAAQKLANRNPAFRAALNTIPGPALNVQVGETAESIKTKSPALVAALTEDQMLAARGRAMWSFPAAHIAESPSSRPVITRIRLFAAGRRASASDGQRIRASPAGIAEFIENSPQKVPFADQDRAALSPS
nr:hypothetical protein [Acidobacteriota bacterium]